MPLLRRFFLSFGLLGVAVLLSPVIANTVTFEFGLHCPANLLKNDTATVKLYYTVDGQTPKLIIEGDAKVNDMNGYQIRGNANHKEFDDYVIKGGIDFFLKIVHFCGTCKRWSYIRGSITKNDPLKQLGCIDLSKVTDRSLNNCH